MVRIIVGTILGSHWPLTSRLLTMPITCLYNSPSFDPRPNAWTFGFPQSIVGLTIANGYTLVCLSAIHILSLYALGAPSHRETIVLSLQKGLQFA